MACKLFELFLLLVLVSCASAQTMITNCQELQDMNLDLAGDYALANDVDCSDTSTWNGGEGFEPVGTLIEPFVGAINGSGFTINSLFINRPTADHIALVGYAVDASFSNIEVKEAVITGNWWVGIFVGEMDRGSSQQICTNGIIEGDRYVGGLAGFVSSALVENCYAEVTASGSISSSNGGVGGLIGNAVSGASIKTSHSAGQIFGRSYIAGLVGLLSESRVERSYSSCSVFTHTNYWVGGLVGSHTGNTGIIQDSYATGHVQCGRYECGGLVGSSAAAVIRSYAIGAVVGEGPDMGGLIGVTRSGGGASHSYWDIETTGRTESAGGEGKTTAEMLDSQTYVSWDFDNIWWMPTGSYPLLRALTPPPTPSQTPSQTPTDTHGPSPLPSETFSPLPKSGGSSDLSLPEIIGYSVTAVTALGAIIGIIANWNRFKVQVRYWCGKDNACWKGIRKAFRERCHCFDWRDDLADSLINPTD